MVLTGEAGIGKTSLLAELAHRVGAAGGRKAIGAASMSAERHPSGLGWSWPGRDGLAFVQHCQYPEGAAVLCVTVARTQGGKITSQTGLQVWDG